MTELKRSPSFKYVYAGGFGAFYNGQELIIKFGIKDSEKDEIYEEIGVVMNPSTTKLLSITLKNLVAILEKNGGEIAVDSEKLALIENLQPLNKG